MALAQALLLTGWVVVAPPTPRVLACLGDADRSWQVRAVGGTVTVQRAPEPPREDGDPLPFATP